MALECLGSWWRVEEHVGGGSDGKCENPQDTVLVLFAFLSPCGLLTEPSCPGHQLLPLTIAVLLSHASRFKSNCLKDMSLECLGFS